MKEKGITLIGLIITIIILLILAGVTLSLTIGENGIFNIAKQAKEKQKIAEYIEKIELARANVLVKNMGTIKLDDLIEEIYISNIVPEGNVGKVNEEKAYVTTEEGYIFKITLEKTEYIGKQMPPEGEITFGQITWAKEETTNEYKAKIKIQKANIVPDNIKIQYQINTKNEPEEDKWTTSNSTEKTITVENLEYQEKIYARLWNGESGGEYIKTTIEDNVKPQITLKTEATANSITVTVTKVEDYPSGMPETPEYIFYIEETNEDGTKKYIEKQKGIATSYTYTGLEQGTTYKIKVTTKDKAGNIGSKEEEETIQDTQKPEINKIEVTSYTATITAKDNSGKIAVYAITTNLTSPAETEYQESASFTNLKADTTYYAWAKDSSGNETSKSFTTSREPVNAPKIAGTGLIPVTINTNGTLNIVEETNEEWYNYKDTSVEGKSNKSKWANAKTADESLWVWIPRYAYKITYTNSNNKSVGGKIDVVFLKDDTNKDFKGNDVTSASYVNEDGEKGPYIVHPAFRDGSTTGYQNGEWKDEITGFWMAKFEAGYAGTACTPSSAVNSDVRLKVIYAWSGSGSTADFNSNYYGERKIGDKIKYPVFMASRPSLNYLSTGDAFDLCQNLTADNNPYGLTTSVDSHLPKNSEWGAVAYLTHSKYGIYGQKVRINNINVNGANTIYAVTGYGASSDNANEDVSRSLLELTTGNPEGSWTTSQGQTASSTKNVYGIYDLSGGAWEWTAGYIATTTGGNYQDYGGSLKGESNEYKSKYAGTSSTSTNNYKESVNKTRIGEAIWETSMYGDTQDSWNLNWSKFLRLRSEFFLRGGAYDSEQSAGIFAYDSSFGGLMFVGFRAVLIT